MTSAESEHAIRIQGSLMGMCWNMVELTNEIRGSRWNHRVNLMLWNHIHFLIEQIESGFRFGGTLLGGEDGEFPYYLPALDDF